MILLIKEIKLSKNKTGEYLEGEGKIIVKKQNLKFLCISYKFEEEG